LIVLDTLRADAVSSYGKVANTTPTMDALAKTGIRYARAFAPAPWTVSSHTSLFTGLRVDQHGVGLGGALVAPASLSMLAERFQAAGYVTAGFAENTTISTYFGFDQGFDRFESKDIVKIIEAHNLGESPPGEFGLVKRVRDWAEQRDKSRPFFLFINIFDSHDPYEVRDLNPWIPKHVRKDEAEYITSRYWISSAICDALPLEKDLEILRGLYLGDVAAADAKLGELLKILQKHGGDRQPLTIVTSDHGEHLGENRLMGHQFTVRNAVLDIPLILSGLPGVEPAVIDTPVELRQIRQSLLCWALAEDCPASLPLQPASGDTVADGSTAALQANETDSTDEAIFSLFGDSVALLPSWILDQLDQDTVDTTRDQCDASEPVFGDMVSMIRYPMKITWFEKHDPVLHDLSWDPDERFDQMQSQPEVAGPLLEELEKFVRENVTDRKPAEIPRLSEEGIRALESLGYLR
jgi:arylsulfatase A-like enzyme